MSSTRINLKMWDKGSAYSELLAAHILKFDGFEDVDPIHPYGGRDGKKDMFLKKDGKKWIGAVYFSLKDKHFNKIKSKFKSDLKGVDKNNVEGFAFVTNQPLLESECHQLIALDNNIAIEIYDLDRIVHILDQPIAYGIRLKFLDIQMTKEDQISFFTYIYESYSDFQKLIVNLEPILKTFLNNYPTSELHISKLRTSLASLQEFKKILDQIASPFAFNCTLSHIQNLRVPLQEIQKFKEVLHEISSPFSFSNNAHIRNLNIPLNEIKQYEETLDRILKKQKELAKLIADKDEKGESCS